MLLFKVSNFILATFFVFSADEPVIPPEPEAPKGLTIVDSATFSCEKAVAEPKCEFYLIYDGRDDIVYLVKKGKRSTDSAFTSGSLQRETIVSESFFSLDLVKEFSSKTSPVESYNVGFKMVDGVLKIRVTLHFQEDQPVEDGQEARQTEKLVDVDLYKT